VTSEETETGVIVNADLYPRFSEDEFAKRYAATRALMSEAQLDVLVIYGNSGISRHNHADVHYLSGFLGNRNNYLVVPLDGEPVLYVQSHNHVSNAREAATIRTEWGGRDSGSTIARHILEARRPAGTLGYVGDIPVQGYLTWQEQLAGWRFKDVTGRFRTLRLVKSEEEIAWLRKGATLTDAAVEHLVANIRPGMHEYELAGLVEAAALSRGGLPHLCYASSGPQEGASACVPRQNLSNRIIERGDVINFEISVSYWGYSGQVQRPIFVECQPNTLYHELWACALEAYERCVKVLRAGATSEDVLDAADVIAERGFTINDGFLHGFAIGLLPPSIGTRQAKRGIPKPPFRFEANMCVVAQPNVVTPDERAGVQLGNLFRITADGAECLHQLPLAYYVTG
jgi:Xaa-Pro aminopeptidase